MEAFQLYETDFLLILKMNVTHIDEIQESSEIYNCILSLLNILKPILSSRGSVSGRIYDPEFRYSMGDVTKLTYSYFLLRNFDGL